MKKFELQSTCKFSTVTWNSRLINLHKLTRLYIVVNNDLVSIGVSEPDNDLVALAEINLNKDFDDVSLKVVKPVMDYINQHNNALVDEYDLDGLVNMINELLRDAGLVDKE